MPSFETSDQTTIFYHDWGTGDPIVLIHGWPLDADMWEYQIDHLVAAGFRCIAYDRRGFGRSGQPWSGYDYDRFADDLDELIRHLGLRDVALVGFSMGGGEVARYLARHGSANIAKAVLVASVTPFLLKTADHEEGVDKSVFDAMVDDLRIDRPHFLAGFGKTFFGAGPLNFSVSAEIMGWTHNLAMLAAPKATIACVRAFSQTDFRPDMVAFDIPTLVVHGNADSIVPIEISGLTAARLIPHAQLQIYEGAPHALFFTEKERLNADLVRFLGKNAPMIT